MKYNKFSSDMKTSIVRLSDTAWIPVDEGNRDYLDFLEYCTENQLTLDDIPEYTPGE